MTTTIDGVERHETSDLIKRGLVYHQTSRMACYTEHRSEWMAPAVLPSSGDAYSWMEALARQVVVYDPVTGVKLKKGGVNLDLISNIELYRRIQGTDQWAHITDFHYRHDTKQNRICFDPMLKKQKNNLKNETVKRNKEGSMKVLRFYTTGSETGAIHCCDCGKLVDGVKSKRGNPRWAGQVHHLAFRGRKSKHKEGPDPSKNFATCNLYEPKNAKRPASATRKLNDITNCTVLCGHCHTVVHFEFEGDISDFELHELPYALQSKSKWDRFVTFCRSLGYTHKFKSYAAQIEHQKL